MKCGAVAVALVALLLGCGNDFQVPTRDGGVGVDGAGVDGAAIDDGSGVDRPRVLDGAMVDSGEDTTRDGGVSCAQLKTMYDGMLAMAKACNPLELTNSCTILRKEHIDCGCQTSVSSNNSGEIAALDAMVGQWNAMGCMVNVSCIAIACPTPAPGDCMGTRGLAGACR